MKFSVPDMSCGHCTAAIEQAIKAADPFSAVACNLETRQIDVMTDLEVAEVSATIEKAGFTSSPTT